MDRFFLPFYGTDRTQKVVLKQNELKGRGVQPLITRRSTFGFGNLVNHYFYRLPSEFWLFSSSISPKPFFAFFEVGNSHNMISSSGLWFSAYVFIAKGWVLC